MAYRTPISILFGKHHTPTRGHTVAFIHDKSKDVSGKIISPV